MLSPLPFSPVIRQCLWKKNPGRKKKNSKVIRQKGESQSGGNKKTKYAKFLTPHTYHGVRNVRFSANFAYFVFLLPPFWDSPFCLITDDFAFFGRFNQGCHRFWKSWKSNGIFFVLEKSLKNIKVFQFSRKSWNFCNNLFWFVQI